MSREANVLVVAWDGAGDLPPQRALVRALLARGHTVRVLAHDADPAMKARARDVARGSPGIPA